MVVKIYGPFLGTLNNRCRIIIRIQKGTLILTTTHMGCRVPERSEGLGVPRRGIDALVWAEPPKSRLLLSL